MHRTTSAELVGIEPGGMVIRREEVTTLRGKPRMLSVDWIPTGHVMAEAELLGPLGPDGPAQVIATVTGRQVTHAQDHLEGREADAREAGGARIPSAARSSPGRTSGPTQTASILYGEWVLPAQAGRHLQLRSGRVGLSVALRPAHALHLTYEQRLGQDDVAALDAIHEMPDKDRGYRSKSCFVPQIAARVYGVANPRPSQLYAVRRALYRLEDEGEVTIRHWGGELAVTLVEPEAPRPSLERGASPCTRAILPAHPV